MDIVERIKWIRAVSEIWIDVWILNRWLSRETPGEHFAAPLVQSPSRGAGLVHGLVAPKSLG